MRDIFLDNSKCLQYVPLLSWWLGYCQLCSDEEIWKHLLCFFFLDVAKKDEDTYSMIHSHKDQNQERYWRGWPASPLTALKVYGSKTSLTEQGTNPIYEKRVILFNKFCAFEPTRAYQEAEAKGAVEDNTVPCCQHEPFSFRHLPGGAHNALHMHWVETQPKLTWRLQICKLKWPLWKEPQCWRRGWSRQEGWPESPLTMLKVYGKGWPAWWWSPGGASRWCSCLRRKRRAAKVCHWVIGH